MTMSGWSLQYELYQNPYVDTGASTGPAYWYTVPVNGQLLPGQYLLVEVDGGHNFNADLYEAFPPASQLPSGSFNYLGTIVLVRSTSALPISFPFIQRVLISRTYSKFMCSLVPADGTPCAWTERVPVPSGLLRRSEKAPGCTETHNNGTDFVRLHRQPCAIPKRLWPLLSGTSVLNTGGYRECGHASGWPYRAWRVAYNPWQLPWPDGGIRNVRRRCVRADPVLRSTARSNLIAPYEIAQEVLYVLWQSRSTLSPRPQ